MSDNMCKWKSKYNPDYQCKEPITCDDYCVLHYSSEDKEAGEFNYSFEKKVRERIDTKEKEIDLKGCYFPEDFPTEYFIGRTFDRPVDFSEARFSQEARFSGATFSQEAYFSGATFSKAEFLLTTFSQEARFSGTTFSQVAYFIETKFLKEAYFQGVKFLKETYFLGVKFSQADFSWAEFKERVLFLPIKIIEKEEDKEVKGLRRAILGPSKFHRTRFLGEVVFEDVDLSQCSFLHSNIDKVDFRYCKFGEGEERFFGIIPSPRQNVLRDEKDCDKEVHEWTGSSLVPTGKMTREGYEPVHRLYLELKKNFEEKKDWNTAGDFHFGEMESRRKMKDGWLRRNILSLEALYHLVSGYGERPKRAGFWTFFLIVVFALFYMPSADKISPVEQVVHTSVETASQESAGNTIQEYPKGVFHEPTAPDLPVKGCSGRACSTHFKKYLEGFKTSLRVTVRLDTEKTEEKGWPDTIQSILGPILIALFFLALRRKVKR